MSTAVRFNTLNRLINTVGWGFVPTSFKKDHLLQMYKSSAGAYVRTASWNHKEVLKNGISAYGSDKLSNYYCLTVNGMIKLSKEFSDNPNIKKLKKEFFGHIFVNYDKDWIKFRMGL